MLVNSSRSSTNNSSSSLSNSIDTSLNIPSTIIWTQTLESITLQIRINHVRVLMSEKCLKLCNRSKTITLPLFDRVYIDQCDIDQMMITNNDNSTNTNNIMILTLEKECYDFWPHLLMQQADEEIEAHLIEANFLVHINQQENLINTITAPNVHTTSLILYDTLDFETVINGQGEKTGLE